MTSTARLAARRLAGELQDAGVTSEDFSTGGLTRSVESGAVTVDERTTVIHDEAALASTRELRLLIELAGARGARLILVGDAEQSRPVGAGGLWPHIGQIASETDAHMRLTANVRALDPEDRRDQQRFCDGEQELALRGCQDRDRLRITDTQIVAEDRALVAAQQTGKRASGRL